jgi:hypothetical protein
MSIQDKVQGPAWYDPSQQQPKRVHDSKEKSEKIPTKSTVQAIFLNHMQNLTSQLLKAISEQKNTKEEGAISKKQQEIDAFYEKIENVHVLLNGLHTGKISVKQALKNVAEFGLMDKVNVLMYQIESSLFSLRGSFWEPRSSVSGVISPYNIELIQALDMTREWLNDLKKLVYSSKIPEKDQAKFLTKYEMLSSEFERTVKHIFNITKPMQNIINRTAEIRLKQFFNKSVQRDLGLNLMKITQRLALQNRYLVEDRLELEELSDTLLLNYQEKIDEPALVNAREAFFQQLAKI